MYNLVIDILQLLTLSGIAVGNYDTLLHLRWLGFSKISQVWLTTSKWKIFCLHNDYNTQLYADSGVCMNIMHMQTKVNKYNII